MISMIAAFSINRIIGMNKKIPWYIPDDLAWFKRHTIYKMVVMGRITFESIGKPLVNRINIILSRSLSHKPNFLKLNNTSNIILLSSFKDIFSISLKFNEIVIIGGESIYRETLRYVDRLYLTHIYKYFYGDKYFPDYNIYRWKTIYKKFCESNTNIEYPYCFEILDKVY